MTREKAKEELWKTRETICNFKHEKIDENISIGLVTRSDETKLYNKAREIIDKIFDDLETSKTILIDAPSNIEKSDHYWGTEEKHKETASIKNKDNNCKDYKPSLLYKILTFIKIKGK